LNKVLIKINAILFIFLMGNHIDIEKGFIWKEQKPTTSFIRKSNYIIRISVICFQWVKAITNRLNQVFRDPRQTGRFQIIFFSLWKRDLLKKNVAFEKKPRSSGRKKKADQPTILWQHVIILIFFIIINRCISLSNYKKLYGTSTL
jgi:hypothetical protein